MLVNGINIDLLDFLSLAKTMDNFQFPALGAGISTLGTFMTRASLV